MTAAGHCTVCPQKRPCRTRIAGPAMGHAHCSVCCQAVLCCAMLCRAVLFCAGGRHITQRIKHEMHAFWNVLEWLANTILFIWVGIALAFVLLEPSSPALKTEIKFSHHLSPTDAGYAVVLYLWLLVGWVAPCHGMFSLCNYRKSGKSACAMRCLIMLLLGTPGWLGLNLVSILCLSYCAMCRVQTWAWGLFRVEGCESPNPATNTVLCAMCAQVARGAAIFLFYPLLSTGRVGYPMTWKTALFMVWAGLRGAVSC